MQLRPRRIFPLLIGAVAVVLLAASCEASSRPSNLALIAPTTTTTTTAPPTTTTSTSTTTTSVVPVPPADARQILDTGYGPFLTAGDLTLDYPTQHVERIGFHESTLAGAQSLVAMPGVTNTVDMPTRDRLTITRGAADILSDPNGEVRAPTTGRVKRGGTYTLYCKYTDSFVVIAPDAHPGWEVKLLHLSGLTVRVGERVEAGVTEIAARPDRLPFKSQVEDYSAAPVWPHVHLEVDDPSIKNPPGVGGGGCS